MEAVLAYTGAGAVAFGWIVGHPSVPVVLASVGGVLTWVLLMALPWPVAAWVGSLARRDGRPGVVSFLVIGSAGTLAVEGALTHSPWPLPWGLLGHTQALVPTVRDAAALAGAPALSAWVLGANATVVLGLRGRPTAALVGLLVLAGTAAGAAWTERDRSPSSRQATVWMVQPNMAAASWADIANTARVRRLLHLTNGALDTARTPPDLVVWPETALPPDRPGLYDSLRTWTARHDISLLTGAVARIHDPAAAYDHANRAVLFGTGGPRPHYDSHYDKAYPVPFVEHVPGASSLPALRALRVDGGGVQGYRAGRGATPLATDSLIVGPLICFESAVSPHARRYVVGSPPVDMLVTLAQTGWWGTAWPARQHRAIARLRAIETGRPLLLASVRGPTTVVLPDGSAGPSRAWNETGVVSATVSLPTALTVYARTGDWIAPVSALLFALGTAVALVRHRSRHV